MKNKNILSVFLYSAPDEKQLNAMLGVTTQQPKLVNLYVRLFPALGILVSPSNVRNLNLVISRINALTIKNGKVGITKYLKVCSVCLQQAIGGHILKDVGELGMRISRTNSGLPRIIPAQHRALIKQGNPGIIRLYLTIFALYRIIMIPAKVKLESISDPTTGTNLHIIDHYAAHFIKLFVMKHFKDHMSFIMKFRSYAKLFVIWKSSAGSTNDKGTNPFATHPITVVRTGIGLLLNRELRHALFAWFYESRLADGSWVFDHYLPLQVEKISTNLRSIWMSIVRLIDMSIGHKESFQYTSLTPGGVAPNLTWTVNPLKEYKPVHQLGKLALKKEAAGKMRVFALVDPFTQWALYPLHKVILYVLSKYSMDGTFNQVQPLEYLKGSKQLYSLDLSSATDRLPISVQRLLIEKLFKNKDLADKWVRLLVGRSYSVPKTSYITVKTVKYAVGQPMGALSSWAMLALTHHFIVQCAAWNSGRSKSLLYTNYALLGDDLVLGDKPVMVSYLRILEALGVKCGLHKSVISDSGDSLEFAKRTYYKGIDVSPISFTEFIAATHSISEMVSFAKKYNLTLSGIARVLGYGWRVISSTNKPIGKLNAALRGLTIAMIVPTTPEEVERLFNTGRMIRLDIENYLNAFVRYEFSRIRDDLRKHIMKDASIDYSYLPIFKGPLTWYQMALQEVILKLLNPIRLQATIASGNLATKINQMIQTMDYKDIGTMYLDYLEVLKASTLIQRETAGLKIVRTQQERGKSPAQLKIWNRWSPYFQGKDLKFESLLKSTKFSLKHKN